MFFGLLQQQGSRRHSASGMPTPKQLEVAAAADLAAGPVLREETKALLERVGAFLEQRLQSEALYESLRRQEESAAPQLEALELRPGERDGPQIQAVETLDEVYELAALVEARFAAALREAGDATAAATEQQPRGARSACAAASNDRSGSLSKSRLEFTENRFCRSW